MPETVMGSGLISACGDSPPADHDGRKPAPDRKDLGAQVPGIDGDLFTAGQRSGPRRLYSFSIEGLAKLSAPPEFSSKFWWRSQVET